MIIHKISDVIEYKIGPLTIKVTPLSFKQKSEINALIMMAQKSQDIIELQKASLMSVKMALKEIKGLKYADGSEWSLQFENGLVSDDSLDELLNLEMSAKIVEICGAFINSIPSSIEGVELIDKTQKKDNKKKV